MTFIATSQGSALRRPDAYTKVHLRMNGEGSVFKDLCGNTCIPYGNVTQKKSSIFNGNACFFDGSGDYILIPYSSSLNFGSSNFTVEFEFCATSWGAVDQWGNKACFISRDAPVAAYGTWTILVSSTDKIVAYCIDCTTAPTNVSLTSASSLLDGKRHKIEWVRYGSSWMLFIDGVLESTSTYSVTVTDINQPISIGKDQEFGRDYNGEISELRISHIARYTASHTPQTRRR